MYKILLLLIIILTTKLTFSQNEKVKYLDAKLEIVTSKEAKLFDAMVTKLENGYYAKIYNQPDKIAMEGTYYDKKLTIKNGAFIFNYIKNNTLMAKGNYEYDVHHGVWQKWYETGTKKDSGRLYYGKKVGFWKYWYPNGQLETESKYVDSFYTPLEITRGYKQNARPLVIANYLDGYFDEVKIGWWLTYYDNGQLRDSTYYKENKKLGLSKSWFENGNLESEGSYNEDMEEGIWTWYNSNGNLATEEEYKEGKVTDMKCYDSTGKYVSDYCSLSKPAIFPGGIIKFENYVLNNLIYPPEESLALQGTNVNCTFMLDKNGKYKSIHFNDESLIHFNKQVIKLLNQMPAWEPAISHNRLAEYTINLNVVFYKKNKPVNE
jgi:antitoxin component YwqK of YwqJK toxin-antitoxin module